MTNRKKMDALLQALWQRRDELDEWEWKELYQLIRRVLMSYLAHSDWHFREEDKDDHISDFFLRKVLEPVFSSDSANQAAIYHTGTLCVFFQRFLIDTVLKSRKEPLDHSGEYQDKRPTDDEESGGDPDWPNSQTHEDSESSNAQDASELEIADIFFSEVTRNQIATAAREFLESQESWVRLYLRYHFCAPCFNETPVRLVRFKGHIPSYHPKAEKLGLAPPAHDDYRRTLLGRWLHSLNLPGIFDDRDAAQAALKILCQQALLWVKDALPFTDAADSAHSEKD